MSDVGLTHVAFLVADLDASIAFYAKYARMDVVHRRRDGRSEVAWMSDKTRPFVVVLVQVPAIVPRVLLRLFVKVVFPFEHLGVACATREEVDERCRQAGADGCLRLGPKDSGPPLGYWALLSDPDGHTLELSYGQEVGLTVERAVSS
jgi:catechol 2,3-dioxygenase-like lactoylglutathione lyase family enzyme